MPELPEVETIKLGLEKKMIGLKIQKIQVLSPKSFIGNPNLAKGQIVLKIWRRAKILGMDLGKITLLFHMKMSGQLVWDGNTKFIGGHPTEDMLGTMPNPHTRVIFSFAGGSHLYFNDQRKFGWVKVVDRLQVAGDSSIKNLGPEPLEKSFTWQVLKQNLLRHKKMPVKVAIMDQSVVSGVGNIYANEACFNAKIDPRTKVGEMSDNQFKSLHSGIIEVLKAGIKYGGSTRVHFVDTEGRKGYFLDYAFVYWRDKYPCKICGTEIKKVSLGGRGTYFCPHCQK
ncbi:MAG: bifunctional DNA-formamidopyrimidine glycosylase/DNA-(apurinic or apyrimidinic site) lyase [Candidatus Daviesbacteria bacterium]|nr:bifunctional DNA-formamidopyrimidine glycosylase/DNA-(apurinic or apyrimidinic site) lyase [Candidatus Daviesbacteria bacterium]